MSKQVRLSKCQGCDCESPCTEQTLQQICRDCGGAGLQSKGIVNNHHIQKSYLRGETEFTTDMVDCLKCERCGHSWT